MGLSIEQLVETVFIEAFPGQSEQMKGLYRFEVEAMVPTVMAEIGQMIAKSQDYQTLQRSQIIPILNNREIDYNQFGQPVSIDNGVIFGDSGAYALSPQRLSLSGSPLRVRNQFVEWQIITVLNNASFGVIAVNPTEANIIDPTAWKDLIRIGTAFAIGDVFAAGVHYGGAMGPFNPGDYVRFQWDANGDLFITQFDANRQVVTLDYPAVGGEVTSISVPGVVFFGDGGQVGIGRIGTGSSVSLTPTLNDGSYRADLTTDYQFLTGSFDDTGRVVFTTTGQILSWLPSLGHLETVSRCDTWFYTFEGEQIVLRGPGDLPSDSLFISGNIIPAPSDLPAEYHRMAIDGLISRVRARVAQAKRK